MKNCLGIDIGGSKVRFCEQHGEQYHFSDFPLDSSTTINVLNALILSFISKMNTLPDSIGIAAPGLVENDTLLYSDVLPNLSGWFPEEALAASCPIRMVNDAKAALMAAVNDAPNNITCAVVVVGTGIGCAISTGQTILEGAQGWSGELGSIPIHVGETVSTLDELASGSALLKKLGYQLQDLNSDTLAKNPKALEEISSAGKMFGLGLATLVNLINPDRLVLGGGTLRFPGYIDAAKQSLAMHALPKSLDVCQIEIPVDGQTLVAKGAAQLAVSITPSIKAGTLL